jgi:formate hydrogenlyase subunit 3/multisubunit Na+/H+ antiporter MnhD subunit
MAYHDLIRLIAALILAGCAVWIAVMNWTCVILSQRNRRRGIAKHYSQVFLVQNLLLVLAYFLYPHSPKWWLWLIPCLDPSNWALLAWPFLILRHRHQPPPP